MEYAGSYALFNYRLVDPSKGLEYSNLRLIRAFEHGLDPSSSEAGFVLTHVAMVRHSGPLVSGVMACLRTLAPSSPSPDRTKFNAGLREMFSAFRQVNAVMETMWSVSKPKSYTSFRTFIFGITSQSMFPEGVIYEGVDDSARQQFRGESGANDSMIPLMDNFCQIAMPNTPLTEILKDFRSYRPGDHRHFLEWVGEESVDRGVREFALGLNSKAEDKEAVLESRQLWIKILNQVRDFRWRHWCFAREYILKQVSCPLIEAKRADANPKQTQHPTATGGSPIVTWLPNQLKAVMNEMADFYDAIGGESANLGNECQNIMETAHRQRDTLRKEVNKYCAERGIAGLA
jgi:indoleamine 2,3-dioxygenase